MVVFFGSVRVLCRFWAGSLLVLSCFVLFCFCQESRYKRYASGEAVEQLRYWKSKVSVTLQRCLCEVPYPVEVCTSWSA